MPSFHEIEFLVIWGLVRWLQVDENSVLTSILDQHLLITDSYTTFCVFQRIFGIVLRNTFLIDYAKRNLTRPDDSGLTFCSAAAQMLID